MILNPASVKTSFGMLIIFVNICFVILKVITHLSSCCSSILEVYLSSEFFNLPTTSDELADPSMRDFAAITKPQVPSLSLEQLNSNVIQLCLILEGIGIMARVSALCPLNY